MQAGFTMTELVVVMAGAVTLAALAGPSFSTLIEANRARTAARQVERELQTARLKAVTTSRALRVRLDCPAAGQLRILEVTGIGTTDNAPNRCDPVAFPSPGPADTLRSTPSLDSPVIYLPEGTTVTGATRHFEFSTRGSVHVVDGSGATTDVAGDVVLTITRHGWTYTITINALGRIKLD
jgi:Tfp pilus assembly protein FimT